MSTTTDVARRGNGAPAAAQSSAVAIRGDQAEFNDKQKAALVAMGVSEKATRAELAVFFHQCQKLRLDPFQRQIYFIHRRTKEGDKWVEKPTTQIGIDGFRVTRDRIERERGLKVEYEDTTWYDAEGGAHDVWLWDEPPAACRFVVKVDGRRFPSVLRFNEYCQRNKDGDRLGRWRDGHAHQIEKCAEADALRRAFPNDLSGAILTDAAPLDDPEAPPERLRVTGDQARERAQQRRQPQQARGEAVPPEDAPWPGDAAPGQPETPPTAAGDETAPSGPAAGAAPAGPTTSGASSSAGAPASRSPAQTGERSQSSPGGSGNGPVANRQLTAIWTVLGKEFAFDKDETDFARAVCSHITRREITSTKELTLGEGKLILNTLGQWKQQAEQEGDHPRSHLIAVMAREGEARGEDGGPR